jgi:hypothetical protein
MCIFFAYFSVAARDIIHDQPRHWCISAFVVVISVSRIDRKKNDMGVVKNLLTLWMIHLSYYKLILRRLSSASLLSELTMSKMADGLCETETAHLSLAPESTFVSWWDPCCSSFQFFVLLFGIDNLHSTFCAQCYLWIVTFYYQQLLFLFYNIIRLPIKIQIMPNKPYVS